jgi:uncharacterized protein YbjT (DUF2867 family)
MPTNTALVIRATGWTGKGVVRHLLKAGWTVHAYVTDTTNDRAVALENAGAKLFQGTLDDPAALDQAAAGCDALFLNLMPSMGGGDDEVKDAETVLAAAKKAGVKHVVHSTVLGLRNPEFVAQAKGKAFAPAIFGKLSAQELVRNSGLTWTIIQPGVFMANFVSPLVEFTCPELKTKSEYISAYGAGTILALVDTDDIGALASAAFQNPTKFSGQTIPLASEKLSVEELVNRLEKVSGKQIKIVHYTEEEIEALSRVNPIIAGQVSGIPFVSEMGTTDLFVHRQPREICTAKLILPVWNNGVSHPLPSSVSWRIIKARLWSALHLNGHGTFRKPVERPRYSVRGQKTVSILRQGWPPRT